MLNTYHQRPSTISYADRNYVIGDAPTNDNLHTYLEIFRKNNVKIIVRLCSSSYNENILTHCGIQIIDLFFDDGSFPSSDIIRKWLEIVRTANSQVIYVHCVSGLGRAPTLVAISLIEDGMDPYEAIHYVRQRRKGAFNAKQLHFIENYQKKRTHRKCVIL